MFFYGFKSRSTTGGLRNGVKETKTCAIKKETSAVQKHSFKKRYTLCKVAGLLPSERVSVSLCKANVMSTPLAYLRCVCGGGGGVIAAVACPPIC